MKDLFKKEKLKGKLKILMPIGAAIALIGGGSAIWWVVQQNTPVEGLPVGSEVLPQSTAATFTFTTNEGQWQQVQNSGNATTKSALTKSFSEWRDRYLNKNGLDYNRDIRPWIGPEVTVAFMPPVAEADPNKPVATDPANPNGIIDTPPLFVLPIANPAKAKEILATPKTGSGEQWVERDYKGQKIREVHGKDEPAYAATVIDNRIVVVSPDAKAVEQVIDTSKGKPPLSRISEYGQAFKQLKTVSPFLRLYVNVPAAQKMAASNPAQPIPPQALNLVQNNQGVVGIVTLGQNAFKMQGLSWLPSDSKVRYRTDNKAQRMPSLLPAETVMMTSGGSLKQSWQENTQPNEQPIAPRAAGFGLSTVETSLENMTGLSMEKDFLPWMDGEYALGLIAAPPATSVATAPAGLMLLVQASDRKAAEQSLKKLDQIMKDRYQFQVSQSDAGVVTWVSQFAALSATHGWLDGNVLYLAIGPGVSNLVSPAAGKTLAEKELFRQATATTLEANNGHFFINIEPLLGASLPVPVLPTEDKSVATAVKAIGVTTAVQDGRTFQFDTQVLLNDGTSPSLASPSAPSAIASPSPASPSPAISPAISPAAGASPAAPTPSP
jgi:hypothetical protein